VRQEHAGAIAALTNELQTYRTQLNDVYTRQEAAGREQSGLQQEIFRLTASSGQDGEEVLHRVTKLEEERDKLIKQQQQLADQQRVLDQEHQQLHPFFRFMQHPLLQSQLAVLEGGNDGAVSSSCRVFYRLLKVYLAAYLMNTKILADEVLRDSSSHVRGLVVGGLNAIISCAASALPGGGLIQVISGAAGRKVTANHKEDVKQQLLKSGHVSSFSLIEAEHLAQLLSLVLTKCFSCQLDQLTDAACKDLARDAVGRITVSLSTALARLEQSEASVAASMTSSSAVVPTSNSPAVAGNVLRVSPMTTASVLPAGQVNLSDVSPVAASVNRLCELFLIALRLPVHELRIRPFWKTMYPLLNPAAHSAHDDWTSDGIFSRSGVAVPVLHQQSDLMSLCGHASLVSAPSAGTTAPPAAVSGSAAPMDLHGLALLVTPLHFPAALLRVCHCCCACALHTV